MANLTQLPPGLLLALLSAGSNQGAQPAAGAPQPQWAASPPVPQARFSAAGGGGMGMGSGGIMQQPAQQNPLASFATPQGLAALKGLMAPGAGQGQAPLGNPFNMGPFSGGPNTPWDPGAQSVDQLRQSLAEPSQSSGLLQRLLGGGSGSGTLGGLLSMFGGGA